MITEQEQQHVPLPMMIRKLRFKIKLPEKPMTMSCDDHRKQIIDDDDDEIVKIKEEEDAVADEEEEEYACSLCGKGFRSRKALGGHMRVHAQQQLRRNDVVIQDQTNASSSEEEEEDDEENKEIRCPICDRNFPSNKSLFGHMRCHPERSWRGIQPPPPPPPPVYNNTSSSSSSSTVSDVKNHEKEVVKQLVDLDKDLLGFGWGAKAIRGRDAITTNSSTSSVPREPPASAAELFADLVDMEPEQVDGVQSLVLLSHGDSGRELENCKRHDDRLTLCPACDNVSYIMKKKLLKFRGAELKTKHHVDHDHSGLEDISRGKKRKNYSQVFTAEDRDREEVMTGFLTNSPIKNFKVTDDAIVANGYNAAAAAADLIMQTADAKKQMHKVRKYVMVNKDFKGMSDKSRLHSSLLTIKKSTTADQCQVGNMEVERYKCTTCNKCFSSHQALGGHKSSHKKLRNSTLTASCGMQSNNDHAQHPSDPPHLENYSVITQAQGHGGEAGSTSHNDQGLSLTMAPFGGHSPHQCNVCFKIYPSGQALGGHRRLHCSTSSTSLISKTHPPRSPLQTLLHPNMITSGLPTAVPSIIVPDKPQVADAAPTVPLAPAAVSSVNKGVFRGFDLNEPPPLEDGDYNYY